MGKQTTAGDWPGFRKATLVLLAGMMVLFGALTFLGQSQKDLDFRGLSMTREDLPDRVVYRGDGMAYNRKVPLSVTCVPEDGGVRVTFAAGESAAQIYRAAEGRAELLTPPRDSGGAYPRGWEEYAFTEGDALFFAALPEADRVRASWGGYLGGTALALLFLFHAAFPLASFKLRYMWMVEEPEPSRLYWLGYFFSLALGLFLVLVQYLLALTGDGL